MLVALCGSRNNGFRAYLFRIVMEDSARDFQAFHATRQRQFPRSLRKHLHSPITCNKLMLLRLERGVGFRNVHAGIVATASYSQSEVDGFTHTAYLDSSSGAREGSGFRACRSIEAISESAAAPVVTCTPILCSLTCRETLASVL